MSLKRYDVSTLWKRKWPPNKMKKKAPIIGSFLLVVESDPTDPRNWLPMLIKNAKTRGESPYENLQRVQRRIPVFSHMLEGDFQKIPILLSTPTKSTLGRRLWRPYFGTTTGTPAQGPLFCDRPRLVPGPLPQQAWRTTLYGCHTTTAWQQRTEEDLLHAVSFSCCVILFRYTVSFIRPNVVMVAERGKRCLFSWMV